MKTRGEYGFGKDEQVDLNRDRIWVVVEVSEASWVWVKGD